MEFGPHTIKFQKLTCRPTCAMAVLRYTTPYQRKIIVRSFVIPTPYLQHIPSSLREVGMWSH